MSGAVSGKTGRKALRQPAKFFMEWIAVLYRRRHQELETIAASNGLSISAPQGAFYNFASCTSLTGRSEPQDELLADDKTVASSRATARFVVIAA